MKPGALTYKCRMCGATFTGLIFPDVAMAMVIGIDDRTRPLWREDRWGRLAETSTHACDEVHQGIGDLCGVTQISAQRFGEHLDYLRAHACRTMGKTKEEAEREVEHFLGN